MPENNGNGRSTRLMIVISSANIAGLFALAGWLLTVSFSAGQHTRQIDVNTRRLDRIETSGTPGVSERLDSIDREIKELRDQQLREIDAHIRQLNDDIVTFKRSR